MIDVQSRPRPSAAGPVTPAARRTRGLAAAELREVAYDLVGRPEHDELSPDEHIRLELEVEASVAAVLAAGAGDPGFAALTERLTAELSPRVESLPVHLRVALANARRRHLLGVD